MQKKRLFLLGVIILSAILLVNLVSAQWDFLGIRDKTKEAFGYLGDFLSPFFGFILGEEQMDEHFTVRVLLLILIFIVVFSVTKTMAIFKKNLAVVVIVSVVISTLSARFMGESQLIQGILLSYGTLGVAVTVLFPYIIFFYFVHHNITHSAGRRLAWLVFAAILIGLTIQRRDEIGTGAQWMYRIGAGLAILSIFLDKTIQAYFGRMSARRIISQDINERIVRLQTSINAIQGVNSPEAEQQRRILQERLFELTKEKAAVS